MPKVPPVSTMAAEEQTGIPKRTIIAAINRGELRAHKMPGITGAFLIEQRDLDKWVSKREARSA